MTNGSIVLKKSPKHQMVIRQEILHGLSLFAVKGRIYGVLCNQFSSITFDETSSYWSVPKSS